MDKDNYLFYRRNPPNRYASFNDQQRKIHSKERRFIARAFYLVALILPANFRQKPSRDLFRKTFESSATLCLIFYIVADFRNLFISVWILPIGLSFSQLFTTIFTITLRLTLLFKRRSVFTLMMRLQDVHSRTQSKKCLNQRPQLLAGACICYILPGVLQWYSMLLCVPGAEDEMRFYLEDIFFGWRTENKWANCAIVNLFDHFIANQEYVQSGLIIVLCWYLFGLMKRIVLSFVDISRDEYDLESLFALYLKFSKTIYQCISLSEQALSLLLLLLYGFMIFSIFNVTTFLMSIKLSRLPMSIVINEVTVFLVMITGFYLLSFQAIAIHDAAVRVKNSVCDTVSKSNSLDCDIKCLILTMATEFPSKVVVTGWGLFPLKRSFLSRTTSGIFTYAILLAQIGKEASK
ncbi:hypothetical protein AVEN_158269-1 [Araneus ventricosus]|uniref:Odorant receptor n=1 Tax=Araneus ventricosus TaxID=182803 RepID=A0A4Y2X0B8_ARAVE|nr:hypothetical protein AVEN_120439-1 [Araneus ventricosus]GBO41628.1 hypothetical protein AVEN_158269-1 [Araneus ventricosus]